jgi:hypothetical protein
MADNEPVEVVAGPRSFAVEGNDLSGYVGTDQEYMTHANETEAPLKGEGDEADDANVEAFVEQVADPSEAYRKSLEDAGVDTSDVPEGAVPEADPEPEPAGATGPQVDSHGQGEDADQSPPEDDSSSAPPA